MGTILQSRDRNNKYWVQFGGWRINDWIVTEKPHFFIFIDIHVLALPMLSRKMCVCFFLPGILVRPPKSENPCPGNRFLNMR